MYPQVFGKYVLEKELSRGGMARVILATLRGAGGFEKRLVVKQIRDELAFDQQFVRRFVEEAKTTVALSHPNIVPVYELGVEQGTYFLAMELVEGVSISDLIAERNMDGSRRVLTPEEGAYVGVEVCRALDYAHRRMKVVHRDITPRNVMIDEEGQVKLIDFGIAAPALVAGHEILGSPGHMAPEQVDGGELGPPTDIFAVAVLLMEAWTGTAPFRRATPEECSAAVREKHPRPSDFDAHLIPIDGPIARAMNVDPRERQQEASELARSLRTFLQGVDTEDIARALGGRVRDLREQVMSLQPSLRSTSIRPSTASQGELSTRTFAAREEALSWSRPPAAAPISTDDDIPVPSTRKLAESNPDVTPEKAATPIPEPSTRVIQEKPEKPLQQQIDIPTVRRAKLERPKPERAKPLPPAPPQKKKSNIILAVGACAAIGVVIWRVQGETTSTTPVPPSSSSVTAAPVSAPLPTSVPPPVSAAPPASTTAPPLPVSAAVSSSQPAVQKASVSLLGEPGTRVTVDGVARGPCPVKLELDPGRHEVRFTFDPTKESKGEGLTVKSGERVVVRSEFTGATPTIRIQR